MNLRQALSSVANKIAPIYDPNESMEERELALYDELQEREEIHALRDRVQAASFAADGPYEA